MLEERRLFVGGCGRSGTTYLGRCFREAGIKGCPHEAMGALGTVSWYFVPKVWSDNRPPFNKGTHKQHKDGMAPQDVVFHRTIQLVRTPLKVINSVPGIFTVKDWAFIAEHTPSVVVTRNKSVRAMRYWTEWNLLMQQRAPFKVIKLEELETHWSDLTTWLEPGKLVAFPDHVSKRTNGSKSGRFAPLNLSYAQLKELDLDGYRKMRDVAAMFGYEVPK